MRPRGDDALGDGTSEAEPLARTVEKTEELPPVEKTLKLRAPIDAVRTPQANNVQGRSEAADASTPPTSGVSPGVLAGVAVLALIVGSAGAYAVLGAPDEPSAPRPNPEQETGKEPSDDDRPNTQVPEPQPAESLPGDPQEEPGRVPAAPSPGQAPHGQVRSGALEEESGAGVFDPNMVTREIRAHLPAIQTCYESQLRNHPTLAGRVLVRFTIEPTGTTKKVRATENSTGSLAVAACVVSTIRRFHFSPGPEGGAVTFAYPFVFAPER